MQGMPKSRHARHLRIRGLPGRPLFEDSKQNARNIHEKKIKTLKNNAKEHQQTSKVNFCLLIAI